MAIRDPQYGGYRIFIGDLGPKVLKQDLEKAFEQFGRILDCWVARNPPGHAFLLFKYPREAERAVERMEGSMVSGRRIRVEHARPHDVRMKEISRRGGTVSHISGDLPHRYGARPKETSHKGPRPRDRGGKDWPPSHSRQWPSHPRKSPPSRHHSDNYDHSRHRRSWSHEHDRYKRRRSEEARSPRDWPPRDRSPRDWPPRDRSSRDRSPRDWPPRDRSPRDRTPRDRSARDRSPRDRSPRDRSPRYRSPKDRSPSDRTYYEDRDGIGSRGSRKLMSVAAPFPKMVVMKTDQGNQTDTEFLAAMIGQVQDSCSRAVGGEQTTPESKEKPATPTSSPVNGTLTADLKCGPEDNDIDKTDDKKDKLAPVSGKAGDNETLKETSGGKDLASGKSGEQAKPEMSDSRCRHEESTDYGKTDRGEKSKGHLELDRPRISLRLPPAKYRRSSSTQAHTSSSSASSTKHRRSSSTQAHTSPNSGSSNRHRESSSIQVQTSPSSASGATSGRRKWSGSDSESDMSEGDNEVSVTGGDVNGNEEVDVNWEKVKRDSEEMVKKDSEEKVKRDSEEMVKKDSEEKVKRDSEEKVKKDSEEMVKNDSEEKLKKESEEKVKKDSEEMVKNDSEEKMKKDSEEKLKKDSEEKVKGDNEDMVKKDSEEKVKRDNEDMVKKDSEDMVKKHTESSQQMDILDIPLPDMTLS